MARKKNLVFETKKRSGKGSLHRFWILFVIGVLAVLAVSIAVILKNSDYDIDTAFGFEKESTTVESVSQTKPVTYRAERIFLLMCAESDRQEIHFLSLVKVKMPECRVTVYSVDPNSILQATENGSESSETIYAKSGERELVSALEKAYDIDIDRYASATPTKFKTLVNYFGGMKITVPEQIEYKTDELSLILIKGNQNLKGDTLYKYMLYLGTQGIEGRERQSAAVIEMLSGVFNSGNTEKRSKIFSQITNNLTTDITIVDFSAEEDGVIQLMQNGIRETKIASYPEEIK